MQNESSENMDFFREQLKQSYSAWNPAFEEEFLWHKISNSIDFESDLLEVKDEIDNFELEVPKQIWEKIDKSLDQNFVDAKLKSDFNSWKLEPKNSDFTKIEERIQLEKVWLKLDQSLVQNQKSSPRSFLKLSALFCLLVISFYTHDYSFIREFKTQKQISKQEDDLNKFDVESVNETAVINTSQKNQNKRFNSSLNQQNWKELDLEEKEQNVAEISSETNHDSVIKQADFLFPELSILSIYGHSIFNSKLNFSFTLPEQKLRHKTEFGINYFTNINFIKNNQIQNLTFNTAALGQGFGLFFRHGIRKFYQDYFISYTIFKQIENTYINGDFSQNKLSISGIKLNTFSAYPITQKFSLGAGFSSFFPLQAVKERENLIVELPKINTLNIGFNLGLERNLEFFDRNKLKIYLKYETIFSTNKLNSTFEHFQNWNLGLKYNF